MKNPRALLLGIWVVTGLGLSVGEGLGLRLSLEGVSEFSPEQLVLLGIRIRPLAQATQP